MAERSKSSRRGRGPRKPGRPGVKTVVPVTTVMEIPWHRDPRILARLERVEQLRMQGMSAWQTSQQLGYPYSTCLDDYKRLDELWHARLDKSADELRAQVVRRMDGIIALANQTLQQDQRITEAVLFGMPYDVDCPGRVEHKTKELQMADHAPRVVDGVPTFYGEAFTCIAPHKIRRTVYRDEKGSAQYRRVAGQVLNALNTTVMNQAKLMGLVVEKVAATDGKGRDMGDALSEFLLAEDVENVDVAALPSANEDAPERIEAGY